MTDSIPTPPTIPSISPNEGTTMNDQLPSAPATTDTAADQTAQYGAEPTQPAPRRGWRELGRSRRVITAGAVVAGLVIGGAGFGAGYAVGDDGAATIGTTSQQTTGDFDGHGFPGDGGRMGGQMPGGPMGGTTQDGGTTGQAPDFDGDGQPDTDTGSNGTDDGATDSSSQNS
jgi:hypothetical protein